MKWIVWPLRIIVVLGLILAPVGTALASGVADVTLFATPLFTNGILTFTITYVSETQLRLDWTVGANVTNVMVRAKYGQYPANIGSNATAPSDGYLVYYGSALSANDTSMDFDQNAGPIYYRAWAQLSDGSWVTSPMQGWKESAILTLLAVIGVAGVLSFLGFKNTQMRLIAGLAWFFVLSYWLYARPSAIAAGSPPDVFAILLLIAAGIVMFFWPSLSSRVNGQERGAGFRFNADRIFGREESAPRAGARQAYRNRTANYAGRVNRALGREE